MNGQAGHGYDQNNSQLTNLDIASNNTSDDCISKHHKLNIRFMYLHEPSITSFAALINCITMM